MIKISKNITFSNDTYWTKKYKKELKIGEKKGYAFKQLGLLEFQNKNIEASTFYFYNALTYNKNCISCWTNMGENFISTNELEKAEKIYTKLLLYIENNDCKTFG